MRKLWILAVLVVFGAACALQAAQGLQAGGATRHTVAMRNLQFVPATITIRAGDTVVWVNGDDRDHNVTANDGSFRSGNVPSGQQYEYRFPRAGQFGYACTLHPRMRGTVIVE